VNILNIVNGDIYKNVIMNIDYDKNIILVLVTFVLY